MNREKLGLVSIALAALCGCNRAGGARPPASTVAASTSAAPGSASTAGGTIVAAPVGSAQAPALPDLALVAVSAARPELGEELPLTLEGAGFVPGRMRVTLDGVEARDVAALDSGRLTCVAPRVASGPHELVVERDDGRTARRAGVLAARATGLPDPGFGPGGARLQPLPAGWYGLPTLAIDPAGRVYELLGVAGALQVTRRTAAGELDPTWSLVLAGETGREVRCDRSGRLLLASTEATSATLRLRRYLPDGRLDTAFAGGVATLSLTDPVDGARSFRRLLVDAQERPLVVWTSRPGRERYLAARWTAQGAPDPTWASGGAYEVRLPAAFVPGSTIFAADVDSQGRLLVAPFGNDPAAKLHVTRSTPDGQPDPGFGGAGLITLSGIYQDPSLATDAAGRLFVARSEVVGGTFQAQVLALTSDGRLDASFGSGGALVLVSGSVRGLSPLVAVDPRTGDLVVASLFQGTTLRLWLRDRDGRAPSSAAAGGEVLLAGSGVARLEALRLDPWGRALVAAATPASATSPTAQRSLWRVR